MVVEKYGKTSLMKHRRRGYGRDRSIQLLLIDYVRGHSSGRDGRNVFSLQDQQDL